MIMEHINELDNLYPKTNELLNTSKANNSEFKVNLFNEIQDFFIEEIHERKK